MEGVKMQEQLTKELKKLLEEEPGNLSKIFELSTKLAQTDKTQVRFSIDAGIIDRLGKELVARHETAVSELVKNAYDADARKVFLTFINASDLGGTLVVSDDGIGMTREQLINGFMRLASSEKLHYPVSPIYSRKRAGKKGIGRFAAQRLGQQLTITTQTENSEKALEITINWDDFKNDTDLMFIANKIEYIDRMDKKISGTRLRIRNLRDKWTEAQIKRVYRYASEILQPFPLSKIGHNIKDDPGFKLICRQKVNGKLEPVANDNTMFFEHALAEIDGFVDDDGYLFLDIKSKKLNYTEKNILLNPNKPYKDIKNLSLRAYYFIYANSDIPQQTESFIREKAREQGGIRLYRNGFRVLPYGEAANDWLGLDASVVRRSILPSHANVNFFGFIEIDGQDDKFDELSSREGLQENNALLELKDFGYKTLTQAVLRIAGRRGVKQSTNQKEWKKEPEEKIEEVIEELEELSLNTSENIENNNSEEVNLELKVKIEQITSKLKEAKEEQKQKQKELIEEKNLLRVLAGLGLTIGEFIHEIKQYQAALEADIGNVKEYIRDQRGYEIANRIQENLNSLSTYTSYFDEAISENVQRELSPIELESVVMVFKKAIYNDLCKRKIDFSYKANDHLLYTCPMHKSEWASILFNLYTNARKAIQKVNQGNGKLYIEIGKNKKNVFLEFSDNGNGIPLENRDKVFNAFFTTSIPVGQTSTTHEEMSGTGLGLKIVKDIINSYGGSIYVKEPVKGYKTTFRIELPWEEGYYEF